VIPEQAPTENHRAVTAYHFAQEPDEGRAQLPVGERQQTATNPVVDVIGPSLFEGSSCSRHCSLRFDANKSAKQCLARLQRTLVTDVANSWGFWHMGQFAADFRRQFGELPSETVRRTG